MKYKKATVAILIIFFLWVGFIYHMSSQTALDSGYLSQKVTINVLKAGEKIGVFPPGTAGSAKQISKYNGIIRSLAHTGMYFLLSGIVSVVLWLRGMKGTGWALSTLLVCFVVSILDEMNQMHYVGRNDNGLVSSGISDIYKDGAGIILALAAVFIIRKLISSKRAGTCP